MMYGVLIQIGNGGYGPKQGWSYAHATRREAAACAERARLNDGWSAKVVEMTRDEALENGWLQA